MDRPDHFLALRPEDAINATASVASRDNSIPRINIERDPSALQVRAQSVETGGTKGEKNAEGSGADKRLVFKNGSNPGVFRPADPEDDYVHVAIPMFVQWDEPTPAPPNEWNNTPEDTIYDLVGRETYQQENPEEPDSDIPAARPDEPDACNNSVSF